MLNSRYAILVLLALCRGSGQTLVDLRTQAKSVDFTAATTTKPFKSGTTLPVTCSIGEAFFKSNAAAGANLYACTALNAWTLQAGTPGPAGPQGATGAQGPAGTNGTSSRIQNGGTILPAEGILNFASGGCTDDPVNGRTDCTGISGLNIAVNGSTQGSQSTLNFISANGILEVCSNNAAANRVDCTPAVDTAYALSRATDQAGDDKTCIATSGVTPSHTCALTPILAAYKQNMEINWYTDVACQGGDTLNISTLGPIPIQKDSAGVLSNVAANDCAGNTPYKLLAVGNPVIGFKIILPNGGSGIQLSSPSLGATPLTSTYTNETSTGTAINKIAKLTGAPSRAILASTTDTGGAIGIVVSGAGTIGNSEIAARGQTACVFDGPTTAGDYVQISGATAGDCHDAGAAYPISGQMLGRVLSTNGASGTYAVQLFDAEVRAASGASSGYSTAQYPPGTALAQRSTLAVTGNLKASDDSTNGRTQIQFDPFGNPGSSSASDWDEFLNGGLSSGQQYKLGWSLSAGSGATITDIAGLANHPGIVDMGTSATSGGDAVLTNAKNNSPFVLSSITNWEFQYIVQIPTALTNEKIRAGFGDLRNDNNVMAFDFNPGADIHWRYCVGSAPSTCVASAITVATTSWYRLRVRSTAAGTALFSISTDGGAFSAEVTACSGCTVNAALPAVALNPELYIDNQNTANDRHLYVDYFAYQFTGLNR